MLLDWKHKAMAVAVVAALVLAMLVGSAWLSAREEKIRLAATLDAQKAVQAEYQKQFDGLTKQLAERETEQRAALQRLEERFQTAATPQQLAQLVTQLMGLQQPIQVNTPAATLADPHPAPVAQVPAIDFPQAKAYLQECEICKTERAKLTADATDRAAQMALAQKQMESLKAERDAAVKASKGGGFVANLKRSAKWFVIGGLAGGAALCGTGHCKL